MSGLIALLLKIVLLAIFSFSFVVLYEHGPQGFVAGVPVEAKAFEGWVSNLRNPPAEAPAPTPEAEEPPAPAPAAAPEAAPVNAPPAPAKPKGAPSAWEQLQSRPIGDGLKQPVATPFPKDGTNGTNN